MLKLIIEDDEGRKTVVPFMREEITIGREEGNTIRLTERNVSRRHARLLRQNGHVVLEDLGSSYGIKVNGDRIAGQVTIGDGDLIQIGDYDLAIQAEQPVAATVPLEDTNPGLAAISATQPLIPTVGELPLPLEEEPTSPPLGEAETEESARSHSTSVIRTDLVETTRKRAQLALDPAEAPRLVVLNTDLAGREFPCLRTELKIGRTDDNDIAIDHRSLSRTHCKVVREDTGEWRVIDLQSANGMMVNGEPYAQVTLRPGDVVELGHVKLQFLAPGQPTPIGLAAASGTTQETRAVSPRAASWLLPALGVLALLVLGGGGYALLGGRGASPPRAAAPEPAPRPADPEAVLRRQLGQAREAIEALDWPRAEAVLQTTRIENGTFTPEVLALLAQLKAEQPFRSALEAAGRQLDLGDEPKARALLETAAPTTLLAGHYQALEARRAALAAEAAARPVAVAPAPPARNDPARARTDEAEALYQESRELVKAQQLEAAVVRLDRCIKLAPLYHACYKALGSAHAKIASRDGNEAERAKGRKFYERYLELAPPDDKDVAKVRGILEKAAADQPQ